MKKIISILCIFAMIFTLMVGFVGCKNNEDGSETGDTSDTTTAAPETAKVITVTADTDTLGVGSTLDLYVSINGVAVTVYDVDFASSDDAVATVSDDGVVTGVADGSTTITASKEGHESGTFTVKVIDGFIMDFSLADDWTYNYGTLILGDITSVTIADKAVEFTADSASSTLKIAGSALQTAGVEAGEGIVMKVVTSSGEFFGTVNVWTNIIETAEEFMAIEGTTYAADGYTITGADGGAAMAGYYMLANDIDLSGVVNYKYGDYTGFRGIGVPGAVENAIDAAGNSEAGDGQDVWGVISPLNLPYTSNDIGYPFSGVLDGRGHVIGGVTYGLGFNIRWQGLENQFWNMSIISYVTGTIKNTGFEMTLTHGGRNTAPIGILEAYAKISNCYGYMSLEGTDSELSGYDGPTYGGLIAKTKEYAEVTNCIAVFDTTKYGGTPTNIEDNGASGGNKRSAAHGGLVGFSSSRTVYTNCYFYQAKGTGFTLDYSLVSSVGGASAVKVANGCSAIDTSCASVAVLAQKVTADNGFDMSVWRVVDGKLYFGDYEIKQPNDLFINAESTTLAVGETLQLTASADGATWTSLDTSKATVDAAGLVTAVGAGEVTIKVVAKGIEKNIVLTVVANMIAVADMDFSLADDWASPLDSQITGTITEVTINGVTVAFTQNASTLTVTASELAAKSIAAQEGCEMLIKADNGALYACKANVWTNIITTAEEFVMIEGYTYENLNQDGAKIIKGNSSDAMKGLYMLAADIDLTGFKNYTLNGKSYFRGIGVAAYDEEYAAANPGGILSILKPSDTDGTARHDQATGENGYGFQGVIDGRGHTVTASFEQGFHYNSGTESLQLWNVCIIGNVMGTVKNTGFILNVNTTVALRRCSPIGYVNGGTVSNCYSKIVFGANSGVSLNAQKDAYQYGGITSWTAGNATIKDCVAVFDTSAVTNVPATLTLGNHGGIVGYIVDNTTKVENCYFYQNKGSVTVDYNLVGNVSTVPHTLVTGDATATSQSVATIAGGVTETNGFDMSIWSIDSGKLYFGAKEIS